LEKDELKEVLRELRSSSDIPAVRQKAQTLLRSVDPKVLSMAEQELLQEGFTQEELRRLCDIHLELLSGKIEEKTQASITHPIAILQEEHKAIQGYLNELEAIARKLDPNVEPSQNVLTKLGKISQMLLEAESHHKREEDALFPRLERQGITGPPSIMRLEHDDLRKRKKALKELVDSGDKLKPEFVKQLRELSDYIVPTLTSHIFKENNILYPTALQAVPQGEWSRIRKEFDEIGYCSFTPRRIVETKN